MTAIRQHIVLTSSQTPMSTPKLREEDLQAFLSSLNTKWNRSIQVIVKILRIMRIDGNFGTKEIC